MKSNPLRTLQPLALILLLGWVLSRSWGTVPPLAILLNPFDGLWHQPFRAELRSETFGVAGLKAPAKVLWDEARVPHIQAQSDADLAWAQGYVHASQRLFQMELQARAGGARLSQLVGPKTLKLDRFSIKIGLRQAARNSLQEMQKDPQTKESLEAYSGGVNAWINQLSSKTRPTEYQILNAWPETWTPLNVAELFIIMTYRLAARTKDLSITNFVRRFGLEKTLGLFPEVMPQEWEKPIYDGFWLKDVVAPKPPAAFSSDLKLEPEVIQPAEGNGSNSWAIGPSKSETGSVIVANDPHLDYSLPAIWFEQELISPTTRAYGGGFGGAPIIMTGFSPNTAWAVTNGTTDVADWYQVDLSKAKPEIIIEEIKIKGMASEKIELPWTELGPVYAQEGDKGLVFHWAAHSGGDPVTVFRKLNQSRNFEECDQALKSYRFPIQNFICADAQNIGIRHAGLIPIRAQGQGRQIMDGGDPLARWQGFFSFEQQPHLKNPPQGFVASANQRPTPADFPLSLGGETENGYRGRRLIEELSAKKKWNVDDMMALQTNNLNPLARQTLKPLLSQLKDLDGVEQAVANKISTWNFIDEIQSTESSVFAHWWRRLRENIWADQLGQMPGAYWPKDERLALLVLNLARGPGPDLEWVDDIDTDQKEDFSQIVTKSFREALRDLREAFGPSMESWKWGRVRRVKLSHVGRIPGFGFETEAPGSRYAISAMQATHGPSLRMVVALTNPPEAWTALSGSSSGEPLSRDFRLGVAEWARGGFKPVLLFYDRPLELAAELPGRHLWNLNPKEAP